MAERRDILFRLLGDSRSLQRATKQGQSALGGFTDSLKRVAGLAGLAFGGRELLRWSQDAIQMASAAEEVDSKFQAVFGSAQDLNDALREWGDLAGVTETDAKNLAATFGNLAMAQGLSEDVTEALVKDVAALAGDMASFNDADPSQVFNDLNKALLTTEREGMKKYGIAITESEVKTRALAIATKDGRTEVTKADRALASYEIALEQAGKAVGDLERTSDSAANRQRQLQAEIRELQEEIGRELLPAFEDFLRLAKDLLPAVRGATEAFGPFIRVLTDTGDAADHANTNLGKLGLIAGIIVDPVSGAIDVSTRLANELRGVAEAGKDSGEGIKRTTSAANDLVDASNELNDSMNDTESGVRTLADALQGDLFKAYRDAANEAQRLLEIQGLLAGGRDNPDYDRGEDYTTSSSIYNVNNGIS